MRGRPADDAAPSARRREAADGRGLELWLRGARPDQPEDQARRGDPLYAPRAGKGSTRFLEDGRIEIDSNAVERSIRPIALNRKNALFAGSDGGASTGPSSPR